MNKYLILIVAFVLMFGCNFDFNDTENNQQETGGGNINDAYGGTPTGDLESRMIGYLKSQGFNTDNYYIDKEVIVVEGDIVFNIDELKSKLNNLMQRAYQVNRKKVSNSKVKDITVCYTPEVPDSWVKAAKEAIDAWNAVPGTSLQFRMLKPKFKSDFWNTIFAPITEIKADIMIRYRRLDGDDTIAWAEYPEDGKPGDTIKINENKSTNDYTASEKKATMAHELGHTIGLAHTDGDTDCDLSSSYIEGSGGNEKRKSVMFANITKWGDGFSAGDIIAVQQLYPPQDVPYVELFEGVNYTGTRYIVEQNHYANCAELTKMNLNDKISSVKVYNGARCMIYEHENTGSWLFVSGDIPDLRNYNINDMVSSVNWNPPTNPPCIELFEGANYTGASYIVLKDHFVSCGELNKMNLNDKISSVKVYNGARCMIYEHENTGASLFLSQSIPNLSAYNMDNIISSINWDAPTGPFVIFYTEPNYKGKMYTYFKDSNVAKTGGNDSFASVRVYNGARCMAYEHGNNQGASIFVSCNLPDLARYNMDGIISYVSWDAPKDKFVIFYSEPNLKGKMYTFFNNAPDLRKNKCNDTFSSFKLYNGARIKFYREVNYNSSHYGYCYGAGLDTLIDRYDKEISSFCFY